MFPDCLQTRNFYSFLFLLQFFWRRRTLMARPMIKEAGMASLLLENPYYILLMLFFVICGPNVFSLSSWKQDKSPNNQHQPILFSSVQ